LSGGVMVLQFARIGRNAFIGGLSGVSNDVLPYATYDGSPRAMYRTINRVGLMRHGFTNEDMHAIHAVYSAVFKNDQGTVSERLAKVRKEVKNNKYAMDAIDFIENRSKRGIGTTRES
jgi:UDP-N-acetylglucosamine acyltransferase